MAKISEVRAREILDSRGTPTVEARVTLDNAIVAKSSVPTGLELGNKLSVEIRDQDASRHRGLGVLKAVSTVNTIIAPKLVGMDVTQQGLVDKTMIELDGTKNKEKLGTNSMLGVSFAVCKAAATAQKVPLFSYINKLLQVALPNTYPKIPVPIFNIINGGKHGAGNLDFQEYHAIPATAKSYSQALEIGVSIYHAMREVLISRNAAYSIGDEGGFAPNLYTNIDALEALTQAIRATSHKIGVDVFLGLDVAASHFKTDKGYQIKDRPVALQAAEFIEYFKDLNRDYHLLLLEDPLAENAWNEWKMLTSEMRQSLLVVGDDLLASNIELLQQAIKDQACSAILVKPNQVGTLSQVLQLMQIARNGGFKIVVSHRSGETNDDFVADLAVATASEYVKFGAPVRGERIAKYNRLLEIQDEMSQLQTQNSVRLPAQAGPPAQAGVLDKARMTKSA